MIFRLDADRRTDAGSRSVAGPCPCPPGWGFETRDRRPPTWTLKIFRLDGDRRRDAGSQSVAGPCPRPPGWGLETRDRRHRKDLQGGNPAPVFREGTVRDLLELGQTFEKFYPHRGYGESSHDGRNLLRASEINSGKIGLMSSLSLSCVSAPNGLLILGVGTFCPSQELRLGSSQPLIIWV